MEKEKEKLWKKEDLVPLFAWLDLCRDRGIDFNNTVEDHLAKVKAESPGDAFSYTLLQVKNKLASYLRSEKDIPANQALIRQKGSSYFPSLNGLERDVKIEFRRYSALADFFLSSSHITSSTDAGRPQKRQRLETQPRSQFPQGKVRPTTFLEEINVH